jgi:hypothetical protein
MPRDTVVCVVAVESCGLKITIPFVRIDPDSVLNRMRPTPPPPPPERLLASPFWPFAGL